MSRQSVDINDILASNELEIKIGLEVYLIRDVPMELFLQSQKVSSDDIVDSDVKSVLHHQLALILNVPIEDVQDLGIRAVTTSLAEIRKWIMHPIDEGDHENP